MSSKEEITLNLNDGQEESILSTFEKTALVNASAYFEAMFSSHFIESTKSHVDITCDYPRCLKEILDSVCKVKCRKWDSIVAKWDDNPVYMLLTSQMFQFEELTEACEDYIVYCWLSYENCLATYALTSTLGFDKLNYYIVTMCQRNFDRIIQTSSFRLLSYDQVRRFLNLNNIRVKDELKVLKALCQWINHDLAMRSEHTKDLLEHVHYASLSDDEIQDVCTQYQFLTQSTKVNSLISIISQAKGNKYENLTDNQLELAKLHLEKPKRTVKREFFLICFFSIMKDNGHCDEELKVIHYKITSPNEPCAIEILSAVEEEIHSFENKIFQNECLLNRLFCVKRNLFAEVDHHGCIKLYKLVSVDNFLINNVNKWYLMYQNRLNHDIQTGNMEINVRGSNENDVGPLDMPPFVRSNICCVHKGYVFIMDTTFQCIATAFMLSRKPSDSSWIYSSIENLHSPPVLLLSSSDDLFCLLRNLVLYKLTVDEGKVNDAESLAVIPVKNEYSVRYIVGTVDGSVIYVSVSTNTLLSLFSYDIKLRALNLVREDKLEDINKEDITALNMFSPLSVST